MEITSPRLPTRINTQKKQKNVKLQDARIRQIAETHNIVNPNQSINTIIGAIITKKHTLEGKYTQGQQNIFNSRRKDPIFISELDAKLKALQNKQEEYTALQKGKKENNFSLMK